MIEYPPLGDHLDLNGFVMPFNIYVARSDAGGTPLNTSNVLALPTPTRQRVLVNDMNLVPASYNNLAFHIQPDL